METVETESRRQVSLFSEKSARSIEVRDLHFSYAKGTEALGGLSFAAEAGKITALLGPNGSGKSTTFKILSTQLHATSGEAFVFGRSVRTETSAVRALMGVTFQSPSLDPWLTVEENLRLQSALYGLSARETGARIAELLKLFRLTDRAPERVKTLSGGLARRAELAKTLLAGPKLLLLDEPTTGLDPLARHDFWDELRRLRDSGMSVLVTTHLMEEADLCDEILVINRGKLAAQGSPARLKSALGNEILTVEAEGLDRDREDLTRRLGAVGKVGFEGGRMRVETRDTERAFAEIRAALGSRIQNLQMGKPTLADVYLSATGEKL